MNNIKGLLIDIDDTLIRFRPGASLTASSLMNVLRQAGHELGGLTMEESARRVDWVKKNVEWWCWSDFISELELDWNEFWEYAYAAESKYLEPTEPGLTDSFQMLKQMGYDLFITSNNPNYGIRHKLRLAGIVPKMVDSLFTKLLGATEMQKMKWEPEYWQLAVKHSGYSYDELAVVGDNIKDDYQVPRSIGLPLTFLIDPNEQCSKHKSESLIPVKSIRNVADILQSQLEPVEV